MMLIKKYEIEIEEILQRVEEVEAENFEKALEKVERLYKDTEIVLDDLDFKGVEFRNFVLLPTIFKITKEEILEHFRELKKLGNIDKNRELSEKEIKKVLGFVECDEMLAKDIRNSIRGSIFDVIE